MRQFKALPADLVLAPTLAQRLQQLRDHRNMTVKDLGKLSRLGIERIEGLEAGMETWLSATERQLLAKALSVEPMVIQEVESRPPNSAEDQANVQERLARAILEGARDLECPNCHSTLRCSIQEALDMDGNTTKFAKAYCMKCPFVLR